MAQIRRSKLLAQRLQQIIEGGEYHTTLKNPPISGRLFVKARHVVLSDAVRATIGNSPLLFGTISEGVPRVKGSLLVVLGLPRPVINMVLMNKSGGVLQRAGVALDKSQQLSLEGNFSQTFTLYCPKQYEADALYVLSPNLMAILLDVAGLCDIEFVDNRVIFYLPATAFNDVDSIDRLPELLNTLLQRLTRQTGLYIDERSDKDLLSDPFRRNQILAMGANDTGHRLSNGGHRIRTRLTVLQKIGVVLFVLIIVLCAYYWVSSVIRAFS